MNTYTRKQYLDESNLDGAAAHRRYYGQFVTPATITRVVNAIGEKSLLSSRDPHLNDIPLSQWDNLVCGLPGSSGFTRAGDYYTTGNGVCLAKEAARQYLDNCKPQLSQPTKRICDLTDDELLAALGVAE